MYIQICKIYGKYAKMNIWWEILGCTYRLNSEITEIRILFWNKIFSMAIHFIQCAEYAANLYYVDVMVSWSIMNDNDSQLC